MLNNLDSVYDAAFDYAKAYHQFLRNMGYTDPSQIPPDMVYPPPDVWLPTLNETFRKYSEKWDEIYARYLALLQQFSKAFNETNYRLVQLWNELNASFADAREKFLNVIIRDINGTLWGIVDILIPLWVSKAQEFYANQTNILKGVIGALVRFQNGTWKYVEIPAGWSITPSSIITPSGQTPSLLLQNWAGGMNPAYTPGNHSQPTYLSSDYAEAVTLTLQLVLGIMSLVLLLAIVNMITRMGRR